MNDRRRCLREIHKKINEGIGCLAIFPKKLLHYLRDHNRKVGLQIVDNILIDEGNINHQNILALVFNNIVDLMYDRLDKMAEV